MVVAVVLGGLGVACSSGGGDVDAGPCVPECGARVCGRDPVCGEPCGLPCTDDSTCALDGARCIPPLPVGSACDSAAMCGTGRLCLGADVQAIGGYCTRPCDDATPCPAGARCDGSLGRRICAALCVTPSDCRTTEGYECRGDGVCPACVPSCGTRVCGDDGCGGSCGECIEAGESCSAGRCVNGYRSVNKSLESPARWDVAAVTNSTGLVSLIGGRRTVVFQDGQVGTEAISRLEVFDAGALTINNGTAIPPAFTNARANVAATFDGSSIWIGGGATDPDTIGAPDGFAPKLLKLEATWRDFGALPVDSRGGALLAMGGLLYYFPGETAEKWTSFPGKTAEKWATFPGKTAEKWGSFPGKVLKKWTGLG